MYNSEYENERVETTFWDDFSIAERFGENAILDTYKRAMNEWKSNYKYLTELVIVLNHKCWFFYERGNERLSKLYSSLYYEAHDYACEHLKGDEMKFYFEITD